MPVPPRPLPPSLGNAFAVGAARDAGVTSGRLRASDLEHPFHGVRQVLPPEKEPDPSARPPTTFDSAREHEKRRIAAYACVMSPHAYLAGRTAAVHRGLSMDPEENLVVGVSAPHRAPRGRGIRGIQFAPSLVVVEEHDGVRTTSAATTWASLGRELTTRQLVVLGDEIVRIPRGERGVKLPHRQIATLAELSLAAATGRRFGVATLRESLGLIRVGSASPLETDFRLDATAAGLPEPELDAEIRDGSGRLLGISEFAYRRYRLAVEVEGDHHRTDRGQWNRDIEKYAAYATIGWEVVRITSAHIRGRRPRAVGMVLSALRRRGWTGN